MMYQTRATKLVAKRIEAYLSRRGRDRRVLRETLVSRFVGEGSRLSTVERALKLMDEYGKIISCTNERGQPYYSYV